MCRGHYSVNFKSYINSTSFLGVTLRSQAQGGCISTLISYKKQQRYFTALSQSRSYSNELSSKFGVEFPNISNVNEQEQVLRMSWLIIIRHDIDDFNFLFLVRSTFHFFTSWSLTPVNLTVTIKCVFSFILLYEFAFGLYV